MISYKDVSKYLGYSDYATLVMVYCDRGALKSKLLKMGADGDYRAYVVTSKDVEIPDYYSEVLSLSGWIKIYDDTECVAQFEADTINVLIAGDYGIIIRAVDIN